MVETSVYVADMNEHNTFSPLLIGSMSETQQGNNPQQMVHQTFSPLLIGSMSETEGKPIDAGWVKVFQSPFNRVNE